MFSALMPFQGEVKHPSLAHTSTLYSCQHFIFLLSANRGWKGRWRPTLQGAAWWARGWMSPETLGNVSRTHTFSVKTDLLTASRQVTAGLHTPHTSQCSYNTQKRSQILPQGSRGSS